METITNPQITKKIIIALIVILLCNFVAPSYINAADDEEGGALFAPLSEFLCGIGDLVIMTLQKVLIGYGEIDDGNDTYYIFYAPKNIFAGQIPAFDINFINPQQDNTIKLNITIEEDNIWPTLDELSNLNETEIRIVTNTTETAIIEEYKNNYNFENGNDYSEDVINVYGRGYQLRESDGNESKKDKIDGAWNYEQNFYIILTTEIKTNTITNEDGTISQGETIVYVKLYVMPFDNVSSLLNRDEVEDLEKRSSAAILQNVIASWYKTLRTISLAGLLSVLVYIGIRIILSSTGQDKAKYKKMFMDWVIAICIVFILQYLIVFIIEVTNTITQIIAGTPSGEIVSDNLMSKVRTDVSQDNTFKTTFAQMIIYNVLVVYTCIFTVTYLKRVVYMAFLTMIAPLIALTYPLDKIKDGQAQAFSMWIKEYIFNALLQVIHIILYTMLIESSQTLIDNGNYIYAIVAIGFLTKGEKFFRKMFGFEKAGTISPVGAAAFGATAMNAMNKIKSKGGSSGGGDKSGEQQPQKPTRTDETKAKGDTTEAWANSSSKPLEQSTNVAEDQAKETIRTQDKEAEEEKPENNQTPVIRQNENKEVQQVNNNTNKATEKNQKSILRGIRAVRRTKFTGEKILKYALKKGLQISAGAALGTVGLAAGIATGDPSKAFSFGLGGIAAGRALGSGVVNKADKKAKAVLNDYKVFRQGYEGTKYQEKENKRLGKKFGRDPNNERYFMTQFNNYKQAMKDGQMVREKGIEDNEEIAKLLKLSYEMNPNAEEDEKASNIQKMVEAAQLSSVLKDDYNKKEKKKQIETAIKEKLINQGIEQEEAQKRAEEMMVNIGRYRENNI